jgi:hypothetical protein
MKKAYEKPALRTIEVKLGVFGDYGSCNTPDGDENGGGRHGGHRGGHKGGMGYL